ncbi:HNH endonuclease [Mesorhizobium sp.]|uniref:HNH endonuclease n=1 Tax=Mesorhizobium sp. TaxID=1871066 RepID=UPI000FE6BDF2|nr:HNH endonuclease [Mesorhizobium sp.]RWH31604.1 MAG: hypothetical protein EOQ76_07250 [Mesorhizobium sp.]TIR57657.1 MAG: hypothetical protein E5X22_22800 [Mesorhizobium sp.]
MTTDAEELRRLYVDEQKSIPQVATVLGLPRSTVRGRLKAAGIKLRARGDGVRLRRDILGKHAKGTTRAFDEEWRQNISAGRRRWAEEHAAGHRVTSKGYIEITRGPNKGRLIHDVLMEARIGRRLLPGEVVHFADDDRQNNHPDNHQLMTRADLARLHRLQEMESGKIRKRDRYGRFT